MEQNKERVIPIVDVKGIKFYNDALQQELIEVGNPDNRISAYEMLDLDDHLEFKFDQETKNVYEGRWDLPVPDHVATVWIRPLAATDPDGMEQFVSDHPHLDPIEHVYSWPLFNIGGTDFLLDGKYRGFREVENPWNLIDFKKIELDEPGRFYFDKQIKNIPFPHELEAYSPFEKLPDHIVQVELPSRQELIENLRLHEQKLKRAAADQKSKKTHRRKKGYKF